MLLIIIVCELCLILSIICALFYAFYLIRKNRKELEAKLENLDPFRRIRVIDRPKLYPLNDPAVRLQKNFENSYYSQLNVLQRSRSTSSAPISPPVDYPNSPRPISLGNGHAVKNRATNDNAFLNKTRPFYFNRKRQEPPIETTTKPLENSSNNVFKF